MLYNPETKSVYYAKKDAASKAVRANNFESPKPAGCYYKWVEGKA